MVEEQQNKRPRTSNLELYRIICMLMIVAGHYVFNGGLISNDGPLLSDTTSSNSIFLALFGFWGKTGINCFVLITGYFMCTSKITMRKFIKLIAQVYFYKWLIFPILLLAGYETFTLSKIVKLIMPFWGFSDGFVSCFMVFYLTIPFLSILVHNLSQRQHQLLILLSLGVYSILGSVPTFYVSFNYITWFGVLFFIASYIRIYPHRLFENKTLWGWLTMASVLVAISSILGLRFLLKQTGYFFLIDSNKILSVLVSVSSFLWFKNIKLQHNKVINAFGAGTFGVLLIHSNSDAMRIWLWRDTVDALGHYYLPFFHLVLYYSCVVLSVFIICNLIDQLRIATFEKWFLGWYDKKISTKANIIIDKFIR